MNFCVIKKFFNKFVILSLCLWSGLGSSLCANEMLLRNGYIEVGVDPDKGRIVHLSQPGGENRLWVNPEAEKHYQERGWNSWGGDRVLFSAIDLWAQIYGSHHPDPVANDEPWEVVEKGETFIHLKSGLSPELGVWGERVIRLEDGKAAVRQLYRLHKVKSSPFPVHVWTLAHVPAVGTAWMGIAADTLHRPEEPVYNFFRDRKFIEGSLFFPEKGLVAIQMPKERVLKVGTFGSWVAWEHENMLLWIAADWTRNHPYIDRSNLQVFILSGPNGFMELETQSPSTFLNVGETLEHETVMGLLDWKAESMEESAGMLLQGTSIYLP